MAVQPPVPQDLEPCIDALAEFIDSQPQFDPATLAHALRLHLGALLHALLAEGRCTAADVREFAHGLEHEALAQQDV